MHGDTQVIMALELLATLAGRRTDTPVTLEQIDAESYHMKLHYPLDQAELRRRLGPELVRLGWAAWAGDKTALVLTDAGLRIAVGGRE